MWLHNSRSHTERAPRVRSILYSAGYEQGRTYARKTESGAKQTEIIFWDRNGSGSGIEKERKDGRADGGGLVRRDIWTSPGLLSLSTSPRARDTFRFPSHSPSCARHWEVTLPLAVTTSPPRFNTGVVHSCLSYIPHPTSIFTPRPHCWDTCRARPSSVAAVRFNGTFCSTAHHEDLSCPRASFAASRPRASVTLLAHWSIHGFSFDPLGSVQIRISTPS
ncbi:hypothetical protein BDZ91DRAFT_735984 [Kalaharituber pfeilii]|nr:hypothetical protein BDZ91DRAFT_735984 [Kalaharituber pfeilii]